MCPRTYSLGVIVVCVLSIVSPFYFMGVPIWEHCQIYLIPHPDGSSWQQSKLLHTGPFPPPSTPFLLSTSLTPCPLAFHLKFQTQAVKSNHHTCLLCHWDCHFHLPGQCLLLGLWVCVQYSRKFRWQSKFTVTSIELPSSLKKR